MKPYWEQRGITVYHGDNLDVMRDMEDNSIDTLITDPPYALEFMGKGWDKVLPPIEVWIEALRVSKPGAMLMAFGGTRTYHRLTCSIEDAGWEIRDCVMWLYGSGFPKSLDISKAIDKAAGAERRVTGHDERFRNQTVAIGGKGAYSGVSQNRRESTAPATDAAKEWNGWGTALKPGYEPIVLAMKPLDGTFAENAQKWGVAGLWIDGGRIGTAKDVPASVSRTKGSALSGSVDGSLRRETGEESGHNPNVGRWPANVILTHHPECILRGTETLKSDGHHPAKRGEGGISTSGHKGEDALPERRSGEERMEDWDCHPDCPVRMLDEQSGALTSGANPTARSSAKTKEIYGEFEGLKECIAHRGIDSGGASRFFYCAKASKAERNRHCGNLPAQFAPTMGDGIGGKEHNPQTATPKQNTHPTVKPLDLIDYLMKLLSTPTGGVVLDPFVGSGTTLLAAQNRGRKAIGIELEEEYCEIAKRRLMQPLLDVTG